MPRLPPLNAVRTFEVAARRLNFNRAAAELHVTPSAVSHQIRQLERFLGVTLFRRGSRQVALTPQGERYLAAVHEALERISIATARVKTDNARTLTVSVAPAFASPWLIPRLAGFQIEHPEIEVRLISSIEVVDFSVATDVDAAVRYGLGRWPGLKCHRLFAEELVPVCAPALRKGGKTLRRPADLRSATLLHALSRLGEWRTWLALAGVEGVDADRGPKFQTMPLALEAAAAGQGVAIADRRLVAPWVKDGRLRVLFDLRLPSASAYYLVYPRSSAADARIVAFRDWLQREAIASGGGPDA
jgi:LysR family glycine cleavage system transcriptional activator